MREARHPVLRGAKTSLFLLAVLCVSTLLSVSYSRPASAESLLYGLTCTVSGLLGRQCQPRQAPAQPTEPPAPAPSTGNGGSTGSDGGSASPSKPADASEPRSGQTAPAAPVAPAPIELEEKLREELPGVSSVSPATGSSMFPAHVAPLVHQGGEQVLGEAASVPIEASESGWKILGVPWGWWALTGVLLAAGGFAAGKFLSLRKRSRLAQM